MDRIEKLRQPPAAARLEDATLPVRAEKGGADADISDEPSPKKRRRRKKAKPEENVESGQEE